MQKSLKHTPDRYIICVIIDRGMIASLNIVNHIPPLAGILIPIKWSLIMTGLIVLNC